MGDVLGFGLVWNVIFRHRKDMEDAAGMICVL